MEQAQDVRRVGAERRGLEPYEHLHADGWVAMHRIGSPVLHLGDPIQQKWVVTSHRCPCGFVYEARSPV